jgi:carbamoyltransferase
MGKQRKKNNDRIILGVYEGHTASACIMINGEVLVACPEERISRLKVDFGFPKQAIAYCLKEASVSAGQVDQVVLVADRYGPQDVADLMFKRAAKYSVMDWVKENHLYWKPKLLDGYKELRTYFHIMGGMSRVDGHYYDFSGLSLEEPDEVIALKLNEIRKKAFETHFGIDPAKITFVPHYACHPYYAYYASPWRGSDVAILHSEGSGGTYNSTVYRDTGRGLELLAGTGECDIGRVYHWVTLVLGMKPEQHEYKVMGLAPYATDKEVEKSYPVFKDLFKVEDLLITYKERPKDLYFHFKERLEGHRFDGIAGALQKVTEDLLTEWADTVMKRLGCTKAIFGGGVALNIKASKRMSELPSVDNFFVPASPGDESNCIGASYIAMERHCLDTGMPLAAIKPLKSVYLGPAFSKGDIARAVDAHGLRAFCTVVEGATDEDVVDRLMEGDVVARFSGKMEFGVRALGNRSILADPSKLDMVRKINTQIKYRDFWMPFCPTILKERQHDYIANPKSLPSSYMTMSFDTTQEGRTKLTAAIHHGDDTTRPQVLVKEENPAYYDLIKAFERKTGIGALLNTSFNLHGEPIVCSPDDAIHTFLHSDLDILLLEDLMLIRNNQK